MKWLAKLTLMLLLTSCSAQWHLKRAVQKDPLILEKDTLVVTDTVVSPPVAITDTVTLKQHDTITVVKDRLKVQLVKVQDTIIIDAVCDSDTIITTIEVPYEKIVYVQQKTLGQKIQSLVFYFGLVLLALYIVRRLIDNVLNG
jgi:flagellar biogenesis protein FliO